MFYVRENDILIRFDYNSTEIPKFVNSITALNYNKVIYRFSVFDANSLQVTPTFVF